MRVSVLIAGLCAALLAAAPAVAQDVRVLGRADVRGDGSFAVQWSGSGFEARFTGSSLYAQIDDWGQNIYRIEVDGLEAALELEEGLHTYLLFDGKEGEHTIRVTRRTAVDAGPTYFNYIRADGRLKPTPSPERRMLVVGDDHVTGYGVLGEDERCTFEYATQDHDQAFGAITAEYFGADLHTIAADGRGVVRNYDNSSIRTISELLNTTIPGSDRAWLPYRYQPDIVVVALGASDFWDGDPGDSFDVAYEQLLTDLRRDYPDALIISTLAPQLNGERREAILESINGAIAGRASRGDTNVDFLALPFAAAGRVLGCDWHAGIDSQLEMAGVLAERISDRLNWDIGAHRGGLMLSQLSGGQ